MVVVEPERHPFSGGRIRTLSIPPAILNYFQLNLNTKLALQLSEFIRHEAPCSIPDHNSRCRAGKGL